MLHLYHDTVGDAAHAPNRGDCRAVEVDGLIYAVGGTEYIGPATGDCTPAWSCYKFLDSVEVRTCAHMPAAFLCIPYPIVPSSRAVWCDALRCFNCMGARAYKAAHQSASVKRVPLAEADAVLIPSHHISASPPRPLPLASS